MNLVESISLFPNLSTPDLGCFVRRKHGFETDQDVDFENIHWEYGQTTDFSPAYHQTYFRIMCGEASIYERCNVFMVSGQGEPPEPPQFVLGGDYTPRPSDWSKFPTQRGQRTYWFIGQYADPADGTWRADRFVGHSYDIYENGTLSVVQFDDNAVD